MHPFRLYSMPDYLLCSLLAIIFEKNLLWINLFYGEHSVIGLALNSEVMFKTRAAVFYRDLKPRGAAEWLN